MSLLSYLIKKIRDYLGIFSKRGGGSPIPKSGSKNTTQKVIFCEEQKWSLTPKMQNKHNFFFLNEGFPKGGGGGGSDVWEKFPNNIVLMYLRVFYICWDYVISFFEYFQKVFTATVDVTVIRRGPCLPPPWIGLSIFITGQIYSNTTSTWNLICGQAFPNYIIW